MPPLCKGRWRKAPEGLYPFGRAAQRRPYINGRHICHPYDFRNPPSLLPIGKGGLLSRALKRAAQRDVLSAKLHQTAKQAAQKTPFSGSLVQAAKKLRSPVLWCMLPKIPFPGNASVCFADTAPFKGRRGGWDVPKRPLPIPPKPRHFTQPHLTAPVKSHIIIRLLLWHYSSWRNRRAANATY